MKPSATPIDLHPLRSYLEPRFGNIYACYEWTPELVEAVTSYFYELPEDLYDALLREILFKLSEGAREDQAAAITAHEEPREIGIAAHCMAVKTAPSLELLIASEDQKREVKGYDHHDVALWLEANATNEQREAFIHELDPTYPLIPREGYEAEDREPYVDNWVNSWFDAQASIPAPRRLLEAWQQVATEA